MGLRPSVRSEGDNNDSASWKNQNNNDPSHHSGRDSNSPSSSSKKSISTPPPSTPPQREAWTARGQLLLNFHHAISRAINSPEMMRKCSQIAEDMSRSGEPDDTSRLSSRRKDDFSGGNLTTASSAPAAVLEPHSSIAKEYGAEAALIVENKSKRDEAVRNKSLALGLFSFVALRSGRGLSSWVRKAVANRRVGSSYQFERHLRTSAAPLTKNHKVVESTAVVLKQPSKLRRFLRVALDVTVSTSIAFLSGAFLFMPRPSAYIEDMSKLPLVEGKSVYAEIVCPPLLKEYRRVLEQYGGRWPVRGNVNSGESKGRGDGATAPQLTQEDVSLNVIRTFVENCSKRAKYERALLEERNALTSDHDQSTTSAVSRLVRRITRRKTDDSGSVAHNNLNEEDSRLGTVSIPSPGVPENVSVDLDLDVYSLANDEEEGGGENKNL